ncbi:hypothetical protein QE152_g6150 [Popillia japonica]|uniref:Uncharacterized protein n=1 Tax=Popillia japonica TaxID=7064 RepID=A0AAW1MJX5_POPJA
MQPATTELEISKDPKVKSFAQWFLTRKDGATEKVITEPKAVVVKKRFLYVIQTSDLLNSSYFSSSFLHVAGSKRWITREVKKSSQALQDLFVLQKPTPELKNLYISAKKRHRDLTKNTKRSFYDNIINNAAKKSSAMWKVMRWNTNSQKQFSNITSKVMSWSPILLKLRIALRYSSKYTFCHC